MILVWGLLAPVLVALWLDRCMAVRGLLPPSFESGGGSVARSPRRLLAILVMSLVFFLAVFQALLPAPAVAEGGPAPELGGITMILLFFLHGVMAVGLLIWMVLAFGGSGASWRRLFVGQLGLGAKSIPRELLFGLGVGAAVWFGVILLLLVFSLLLTFLLPEDSLPQAPPEAVVLIGTLPIGVRIALSASAGFFEELFFRGFLQPRIGIAASTFLFAIAHLSYGQPFMLFGITILSLIFALLVRWRRSIWAAVVAHATFDAIQLLLIVPSVSRFTESL